MRTWTEAEYDLLFGRYPPTGRPPSTRDFERLGRELDRSLDSVRSQWHRARAIVAGTAQRSSRPLRDYLERHGWR